MSVIADIFATWRGPRLVMRRLLAGGAREDRSLMVLMGASALMFVSQWPVAVRAAHIAPEVPLQARLAGALTASLFLLPLMAYGLAALSHFVARALGGRGTHAGARAVLFWALLAVAPLQMCLGLVQGFLGFGAIPTALGYVVLIAFLVIWGAGLQVAGFERTDADAA